MRAFVRLCIYEYFVHVWVICDTCLCVYIYIYDVYIYIYDNSVSLIIINIIFVSTYVRY